jgi:hypothetical protein
MTDAQAAQHAGTVQDDDGPCADQLQAVEEWTTASDLLLLHADEVHPNGDGVPCKACGPLVRAEQLAFERMDKMGAEQ